MAFFYFIFVRSYLKLNNALKNEFFIMLQFAILSFILLLNANDFFELYIALEMYGLSIISVVGLKYYNRTTIEAGFKYFIITAVSSLFFLFSFSLIYITTGTYHFTDLKLLLDGFSFFEHINFNIIVFSFLILTLSFLIKLGSFPFNF
jgi:NADH-quinone oxidoreductase subunit N